MDSAAVAEHYNERRELGRAARKDSRIIHLRNFNNWVKSVLIQLHTRPDYAVLDLACGKGGDLTKWAKAKVSSYRGCDVAHVSLQQSVSRYNDLRNKTFDAVFFSGDCFSVKLSDYLDKDPLDDSLHFDIVSCQFAMHYAFENESRVRRLLENVTVRLKPGGFYIGTTIDSNVLVRKLRAVTGQEFGNSIYTVVFEDLNEKCFPRDNPYGIRYRFTLDENVDDCPEFLVHFPSFMKLAAEYDLKLKLLMNFHDFYQEFTKEDRFMELFTRMNVTAQGGMTLDEWDAIYLYTAFVFQKEGGTPYEGKRGSELQQLDRTVDVDDIIVMK
eukprot:Plantae.Rhodophyta-Purpureofilum_apyrenoidigerum.ctg3922.p1 GENE.Plantae.Rhodophyta-Purpureofilum_apyrenoidigerum.ctg3922~~Plantae.Rhodophyta-Purpureofilum_apyrenoidigerum.ctg3922.p1  ORF type:complete len:327 (-),score=56.75 Plantae.Rhodophyta-Purpureofilum_apyrenoidigerum.ctg3922:302-1282(-)